MSVSHKMHPVKRKWSWGLIFTSLTALGSWHRAEKKPLQSSSRGRSIAQSNKRYPWVMDDFKWRESICEAVYMRGCMEGRSSRCSWKWILLKCRSWAFAADDLSQVWPKACELKLQFCLGLIRGYHHICLARALVSPFDGELGRTHCLWCLSDYSQSIGKARYTLI